MDERLLQQDFHRGADAQRFFNRLRNPWICRREEQLTRRIGALRPMAANVLEVGCGEGSNLAYLAESLPGISLHGMDFSEAKVDFARKLLPVAEFRCADAQALPYADASFDIVFCRDLLHHVDFNRDGVLAEMIRVLKPGGVAAVFESRGKAPLNLLFQLFYPVERGLRHSSPETLHVLGQKHGQARLEFVECSFLVRALAFLLGWPERGLPRRLAWGIYTLANGIEWLLRLLLPKKYWIYMLLVIKKSQANGPLS